MIGIEGPAGSESFELEADLHEEGRPRLSAAVRKVGGDRDATR